MGLLSIREDLCQRDGFCASDCPVAIIQLPGNNGLPEIVPHGDDACLECGHCVAVCPYGALSHEQIPVEHSPAIRGKLQINEEQAIQFLRSRRSIRHFLDRTVEREKIRRLIEAARYAPTGGNSQMVEWLALSDKSHVREIAGLTVEWVRRILKDPQVGAVRPYLSKAVAEWDEGRDSVLRGAPAVIVAMAPKESMNGMVDLTLALCYLDLLAPAMGLGTCWAGLLQGALLASKSLKTKAGIPEDFPHHYPIMLGYTEMDYYRLPERKQPKITFV